MPRLLAALNLRVALDTLTGGRGEGALTSLTAFSLQSRRIRGSFGLRASCSMSHALQPGGPEIAGPCLYTEPVCRCQTAVPSATVQAHI